MKRANRLMLIAGVILAAASFVAVLAFGGLGQQRPAAPANVPVVVAAQELLLGTELTVDQLTTVDRPAPEAAGTYQHPEDVVGLVVRRTVAQGQAITTADFDTDPSMPQIVAAIRPGLRAMALPLSRVDSVGGLLQPGDYVDVILTLDELDALNPVVVNNPNANHTSIDGTVQPPYFSIDEYVNNTTVKVVVQNVQVLAALARTLPDPATADGPVTTNEPDVIIVLAVTPQQARGCPLRPARRQCVARPARVDGLRRGRHGDVGHNAQGTGRPVGGSASSASRALIPAAAQQSEGRSERVADHVRVMIVDDIAETREHLARLLSFESDIDVAGSVGSGEDALELAGHQPVDVVLLDINMPGMDGIVTAEQARTQCTGRGDHHDECPGRSGLPAPGDARRGARVPGQALQLGRARRIDPPGPSARTPEA